MFNMCSLSLTFWWTSCGFYLGNSVTVCLILNISSIWKLSDNETFKQYGRCFRKGRCTQLALNKYNRKRIWCPLQHTAYPIYVQFLYHRHHSNAQLIPGCLIHVTSAHHTWLQNLKKTKNTVHSEGLLWILAYCVKMDGKKSSRFNSYVS